MDQKARSFACCDPPALWTTICEWVPLVSCVNYYVNSARLLLEPTEIGGNKPTLTSGLYVVTASPIDSLDERHYVIYWPEDTTWNDSAISSVRRNRVTFIRYAPAGGSDLRVFHTKRIDISRRCAIKSSHSYLLSNRHP